MCEPMEDQGVDELVERMKYFAAAIGGGMNPIDEAIAVLQIQNHEIMRLKGLRE